MSAESERGDIQELKRLRRWVNDKKSDAYERRYPERFHAYKAVWEESNARINSLERER